MYSLIYIWKVILFFLIYPPINKMYVIGYDWKRCNKNMTLSVFAFKEINVQSRSLFKKKKNHKSNDIVTDKKKCYKADAKV